MMKAAEVLTYFQAVGTWVDWRATVDGFLHGDPRADVTGIAVAWSPTNAALRRAAAGGLNLFITHEPAFLRSFEGTPSGRRAIAAKKALLEESGITLLRCHDTWDRMPGAGIPDAWADWLGFPTEPREISSFYKICLTGGMTVEELARAILAKTRPLGQEVVHVLGRREARVNRLAVGTGAITFLPDMYELGADAILATDDGVNCWDGGLWALDLEIPLLLVNHAAAEKPGLQALAAHLRGVFTGVPVKYLDVALPYAAITD